MAESMIAWPLDGHLPAGRHGAGSGEAPLSLMELRPGSIVEVGCWPDTLNRMRIVLPQLSRNATLMDLAPGRWWLVSPGAGLAQELERGIDPGLGAVVDLSDARAVLQVSGPATLELMSRLVPLDFGADRLSPGCTAETVVGHMGVTLHRTAPDCIEMYVFRGFARSFVHSVRQAAAAFGYRVG
ncbi:MULTISPECIES: sarcosine oxidase subunit gamma family protein [unclassified Minwuia]|jgi:methylglutamate dehydrogenase subunit D|uniref:sarcosine oxidase subunit gamma n=1 Tax=unclassified Minwuia TaxID=2618799 RepID=UPI0024792976|nr:MULTISPECIES: sarcosine oxidase subunit gamma family protein [unclassified Minwuia]